jgi:hypothetical protein
MRDISQFSRWGEGGKVPHTRHDTNPPKPRKHLKREERAPRFRAERQNPKPNQPPLLCPALEAEHTDLRAAADQITRSSRTLSFRPAASIPSNRGGEYLDQVRGLFPWPEFNWCSVPRVCCRRFLAPPSTRRPLLNRAAGPLVTDSNRRSIPPRSRRAVGLHLCAPDSVRLRYPSSLRSSFHLKP